MPRFVSVVSVERRTAIVLVLAMALALGCAPGEDPDVAKARTVLQETAGQSQEHERFALAIAEGTDSPEAIDFVIGKIGSDNFQTALVAVDALGDEPPVAATEALRQVFEGKGGALKRAAAIQLARLGDAEALDYLKAQLSDPQQLLSIGSVVLVGRTDEGGEFLGPILVDRVKSEDLAIRNEAYAALGELGQPWATEVVAAGLGQELGEDRQEAIRALGRTGDPAMAGKIDRFANTQGLVFVTLEALGTLGNPESVKAVKPMLANDSAPARVYASIALWKLGEKSDAIAVVNELIQDPDPTVRRILAEQLGSVDDQEARSRLAALAEDQAKEVRIETIRAIAVRPGPEFEGVLVQAANDPEYEVSTLALNILGKVGRGVSVEQIAPLLDSENPYVALSAAHAVLSIRAREPEPA
jgi:HEAT repeat protein